ncbi:heavy metal-binding domain-containing protein [Pseudanabaena sp. FACHB-2040]|uniref:heavy metal-binding domain-containing protein n=1 Tax=Pseudanabaena sp. FACHB-2040 TaxID=2692859 RepID=UPI00168406F2|nr:heavy metal-binding domain-containing protein [Pseudanabaena sp. FACHB-2040]MBD0267086.1 heavy metal-binding domain-containing protein [Cyanobacteria bacterium Co-bin8]MBD2260838.1 heavy metal-binding domain-containing protein [Pseudanabaena sp. FACHB-2040]
MILTTGPNVEGREIVEYCGLVNGEAILGANIFKDFFAGVRDIVGGRSAGYEKSLRQARTTALQEMTQAAKEMGANAIIAIDVDYESLEINNGGNMLMVAVSGTAVRVV